MTVTVRAQPVFAQIGEPYRWVVVGQYGDQSGITQVWGPFDLEEQAKAAVEHLKELDTPTSCWSIEPLRCVVEMEVP